MWKWKRQKKKKVSCCYSTVRSGTVLALHGIVFSSSEYMCNYTKEEVKEGFIQFQSHPQNLWGALLMAGSGFPTCCDPRLNLFQAIYSHQVLMTIGNLVGQGVLVEPCNINNVKNIVSDSNCKQKTRKRRTEIQIKVK